MLKITKLANEIGQNTPSSSGIEPEPFISTLIMLHELELKKRIRNLIHELHMFTLQTFLQFCISIELKRKYLPTIIRYLLKELTY